MNTIDRLRKKITLPNGKRRTGAVARIAEYCGVVHGTVLNWLAGRTTPPHELVSQIEKLLKEKEFAYAPRKTGPKKGKYRWRFGRQGQHVFFPA